MYYSPGQNRVILDTDTGKSHYQTWTLLKSFIWFHLVLSWELHLLFIIISVHTIDSIYHFVCSICLISVKVWCLLPQVIVSKRALKCPSIFLLPSFCSSMLFLQFSLFVFVLMRSLHSRLTGVHVVSPLWIRGMFCIFHHQAQIRWSVHVSPQHALMHSVEKQLIKCS